MESYVRVVGTIKYGELEHLNGRPNLELVRSGGTPERTEPKSERA